MKSRTVARQLAFAMRERDRCGRAQPGEIDRLQIPMQRLLEPEYPMRLDGAREIDALRQIVGGIHVEHSSPQIQLITQMITLEYHNP